MPRPASPSRPAFESRFRSGRWIDRIGLVLAVGCGLHCASLTAVLLLYPAVWLDRSLRASGLWTVIWWTEWLLLASAWLFACVASGIAFWLRRRRLAPAVALTGLTTLTIAIASPLHGSSPSAAGLALLGGLLVGGAHWLNLRAIACRSAGTI